MLNEPAVLQLAGQTHDCVLVDASVDGFQLRLAHPLPMPLSAGDVVSLQVQDVGNVALNIVRSAGQRLSGRFVLEPEQRDDLIRKLFSGDYSNQVMRVQTLPMLLRRLWATAMH